MFASNTFLWWCICPCCPFIMKWKQKNKVNKWSVNRSAKQRMQKVEMYAPISELRGTSNPNTTCTHESWNDSHLAYSFWACKLTYFSKFTFIIACYFGSTCIWGNFFFPSVWLHNNFILRQNKIFLTWPRLKTVKESANLLKPQTKKC